MTYNGVFGGTLNCTLLLYMRQKKSHPFQTLPLCSGERIPAPAYHMSSWPLLGPAQVPQGSLLAQPEWRMQAIQEAYALLT